MKKRLGQYDLKFAQKVLKKTERIKLDRIYFKDFIIMGRQNLLGNQNRQRIYIANHLSHMDYVLLWLDFHRNKIRMPMIPAGANLDKKILKKVGIDFGRLGAYFIDRDLMKGNSPSAIQHKKDTIRVTREIINRGLDFLVFPEGGRNDNRKLFRKYETGTLRAVLYSEKDLDIVPVAFAYDHRVEEEFLPIIRKGNRKTLWGKAVYYGADALAYFFARPLTKNVLKLNVGNAYMNLGEPTPLSDILRKSDITNAEKTESVKEFSIKEIRKLYHEIKPIR